MPFARSITVRAPASIANLGPGFDVLSVAIAGLYDIVKVSVTSGNGSVTVRCKGYAVPSGKDNVAHVVASTFLEHFNIRNVNLEVEVLKGVPPSSGLGSSGATCAATAYALVKLFKLDVGEEALLEVAASGEAFVAGSPHYDNVAASLFGGINIIDVVGKKVFRFKPRCEIPVAVVIPATPWRIPGRKTEYARSLLPREVPLELHVKQLSSLAKLVYALFTGDLKLLGEAVNSDFVVEPHRAKLIPYYHELKRLALEEGALGFNISGAGPSVFFVHRSAEEAEAVGRTLVKFLGERGVEASLLVTRVLDRGAEVVGESA